MANASKRAIVPFVNTLSRSTIANRAVQIPYICQPCRRHLHRSVKSLPVPQPTPFVPDVSTFLTLIGRGLSQHASKFENDWNKLFTSSSHQLKELGIDPPRSRRYLLRWLQRFRRGEFGAGGDFNHVTDGAGELRIIEVPALEKSTAQDSQKATPTTSSTPGMTKLILNVPLNSSGNISFKSMLKPGQTSADLRKPKSYKLVNGHVITGPHAQPIKGTNGLGAIVKVKEGLWEDRRGQKVFGGERRRAETLHKMAVAENKNNAR